MKRETCFKNHRIYNMTERAIKKGLDWDQAIYENEIKTVQEFDTLDEALSYFNDEFGGDSDNYGVE